MANHDVPDTKVFYREYHLWVLLIIACALAVWVITHRPSEPHPLSGTSGNTHNCMTIGPDSPIVTGESSVVVINGKTYAPGLSAGCVPASTSVSTHGIGSPIVTGAGSKVIIHTDR